MSKAFDVIVIGSGIAGLSFALKVADAGYDVCIITKKDRAESNTNYAQGGIACVFSEKDRLAEHEKDTLACGVGLCREGVVRRIVQEGPSCIQALIEMGVTFSQGEDGKIALSQEGGHGQRRILHVKDVTGQAIEKALLKEVSDRNIQTYEHYFAIDFITKKKLERAGQRKDKVHEKYQNQDGDPDEVYGLYALNVLNGVVETFISPVIMISTGGAGQVYQYTTNPDIATGDGIAMAYRAGAKVSNLEFVQFHPTALYSKDSKRFLISEAVRGEGAILRNHKKEAFMKCYDVRGDLAPRDIVARAIDLEMKASGEEHVWLDCAHLSREKCKYSFPNIFQVCQREGIDMGNDFIPVVPAAHYMGGGILTNLRAETNILGLYACGEVAYTGLHGANRLASNSLLEAVVMAKLGAEAVIEYLELKYKQMPNQERCCKERVLPDWVDGDVQDSDERVILSHNWIELKRAMWDYVGIVRSTKRLKRAKSRIENLKREIHEYYWGFKVEPKLLELRNMIQVAELIIECALMRKESRGLHYTLDYPSLLKEAQDTIL